MEDNRLRKYGRQFENKIFENQFLIESFKEECFQKKRKKFFWEVIFCKCYFEKEYFKGKTKVI